MSGAGARPAFVAGAVLLMVIAGHEVPAGANGHVALGTDDAALRSAAPHPPASGSDFNQDGYEDLAVSGEDWSGDGEQAFPGVVNVLYGSSAGLSRAGNQRWTAADFIRGDLSEEFGEALATGDFDGDGYSDLAVGIAENPIDQAVTTDGGRIRIVYGSPTGLARARSQQWSQNSSGILGGAEGEDGFGSSLVAADFGRGPQDDLAVGVAGENGFRGAVNLIYGSPAGLTSTGSQLWTQASPGVPGRRGARDLFGATLAAGRFAGSPYADLAIGVPDDRVGRLEEAGSVNVLYGSAKGLTAEGAQRWTQQTAGIKGKARPGEMFGMTLTAGRFSGGRFADLAVGVPEDHGGRGAVHIIDGSSRGLTAKGDQLWNRNTKGLGGRSRLGTWFGLTMTTGNFGNDAGGRPFEDLAVRADEPGTDGVGVVEIIYGSSKGLATKHSHNWNLDSRGIEGVMTPAGNSFGSALAAGNFGNDVDRTAHDDLAVGDVAYNDGAVSVIYGSRSGLSAERNKLWTADRLHQPGLTFFGQALAAG